MSELKEVEYPNCFGSYYLKSEADKVIEEKDKEIARLDDLAHAHNIELLCKENQIAELKQQIEILQKEKKIIRDLYLGERDDCRIWAARAIHHKYKRCMAMADACENEEKRLDAIAPLFETDKECWEYNSDYWNKWYKRWLAIASKFKEGV